MFFLAQVCAVAKDQCIWYGVCETGEKAKNCPYSGPPKVLKNQPNGDEALTILRKFCPWMYEGEATKTCCDYDQLGHLRDGIQKLTSLFITCPSCMYNMRRYICAYTCDRNQSSFMRIDAKKVVNDTGVAREAITNVTIATSATSLAVTFNSCANVMFSGSYSVNVICFVDKNGRCPEKEFWYRFGHSAFSPFALNMTSDPHLTKGLQFRNFGAITCTQPAPGQLYGCPCQTCPARTDCQSKPPNNAPKSHHFVISIDSVTFIMGALFICFLFVFGIFLTYNYLSSRGLPESIRFETSSDGLYILNWIERLGAKVRKGIDMVLSRWCLVCATNPIKVLAASLLVAAILCGGIATFKVSQMLGFSESEFLSSFDPASLSIPASGLAGAVFASQCFLVIVGTVEMVFIN